MVGVISDIVGHLLNPPAGPPLPFCRIYFQEVGDDLSGQGQYAYYRWWSAKPLILLGGTLLGANFVQFVGLEPEKRITGHGCGFHHPPSRAIAESW